MKNIIVLLCFCMCLLTGCGVDADMILQNDSSQQETDSDAGESALSQDQAESAGVSAKDAETDTIYVYICGAVNAPGVYEVSADSRVYMVVELAGGLSEDADEKSVNLAETVSDGQMIQIPTIEEAGNVQTDTSAGVSGDTRININTASVEELTGLNGIGETKAEAIIAYREAHGGFQSADEIMQVDGIGEGTYQKIEDNIRVE